jgi:hypothetical protein
MSNDWKYVDNKLGPHRYKVNVLNKKGKEVWKYCTTIKTARKLQQEAIAQVVDSSIFQKINGKYKAI